MPPQKSRFVWNFFHWWSPSPCSPQSLTFSHPPARGWTQVFCSQSWQTPPWMRSTWSPPSSCTRKVQPPSLAFTLQRTTANTWNSLWWDAWTKVSTLAEIIFLRVIFSHSSIWGRLALRCFPFIILFSSVTHFSFQYPVLLIVHWPVWGGQVDIWHKNEELIRANMPDHLLFGIQIRKEQDPRPLGHCLSLGC